MGPTKAIVKDQGLYEAATGKFIKDGFATRRDIEEYVNHHYLALPVVDNTYSGATTVLLQAMALAKPVVVSRTRAIASGYGLVDGENCRLVEPGDATRFRQALEGVLSDESHARALGSRARRTVEDGLTWEDYVDRVEDVLRNAPASAR